MKLIIGLAAAAGLLAYLTIITPASAQKDPACTEKCNRENKASGGGMPVRGTAERIRACLAACPPAQASGKGKVRCNSADKSARNLLAKWFVKN